MSTGTVYGGQNFFGTQLDAIIQAIVQRLMEADLMGYLNVGEQQGIPRATEAQALRAIWQARQEDLKPFYDENWGEGNYSPEDAVRNWLEITSEDVPGRREDGTIDPIAAAEEWGYVPRAQEAKEGTREPTLEARRFEYQQELDENMMALEREKLLLQETLGLNRLELDEMLGTLELQIKKETALNANEREIERNELARELGIGRLELDRMIATKELDLQTEALAFDKYRYASDHELAQRAMELEEEIQRGNLGVSRELAAIQRLQTTGELDLKNRQLELDRMLGLQRAETDRYSAETDRLGVEGELLLGQRQLEWAQEEGRERLRQDWERLGLDRYLGERGLDLEEMLGMSDIALRRELGLGDLDLTRELGRGELGLGYLQLLGQLSGPRDWVKYANIQRAAAQTQFPEWANRLASGQGFAPFQGAQDLSIQGQLGGLAQPSGNTPLAAQGVPQWGGSLAGELMQSVQGANLTLTPEQQAQLAAERANLAPMPAWAEGLPGPNDLVPMAQQQPLQQPVSPYGAPTTNQAVNPYAALMNPHQIRIDQWNAMTPTEQQMALGWVETEGQMNPDDWLNALAKAAPRGRVNAQSVFRGW